MTGGCPADYNPGPSDTFCKHAAKDYHELAKETFFRMDRNHDNKVSKAEYSAYNHPDEHRAADRDGDGKLSLAEYMEAPQHYRGISSPSREEKRSEFKRIDKNHDGQISRNESEDELRRGRAEAMYEGHVPSGHQDDWVAFTSPIIAPDDNNVMEPQNDVAEEAAETDLHADQGPLEDVGEQTFGSGPRNVMAPTEDVEMATVAAVQAL